ncbi:MAG: hypothetical protein ACYS3S_07330 [Planctomycetota bacterium]
MVTAQSFQYFDSMQLLEAPVAALDLGQPVTPYPGITLGRVCRTSQLPGKPSHTYALATHPGQTSAPGQFSASVLSPPV